MANLEYLRESVAALDYERRNSVDTYLLGILSVVLPETEWRNAVRTAMDLEARVFASVHPQEESR